MPDMPITSFSTTNPGAELRVGDQLIRFDRAMTLKAYEGITEGGADECKCGFCQHFRKNRTVAYPATFLSLLEKIGIDRNKEGEVYENYTDEQGITNFGGWFFFTGQILEPGEKQVEADGMTYWVGDGRSLPRSEGEFGLDLLALEFNASASLMYQND
jgi:hypothetical protein